MERKRERRNRDVRQPDTCCYVDGGRPRGAAVERHRQAGASPTQTRAAIQDFDQRQSRSGAPAGQAQEYSRRGDCHENNRLLQKVGTESNGLIGVGSGHMKTYRTSPFQSKGGSARQTMKVWLARFWLLRFTGLVLLGAVVASAKKLVVLLVVA